MPKKTLVILAEGFEETEAITVIDILRRAKIRVTVAGVSGTKVKGSHSITVIADKKLDKAEPGYDCLVLPGGMPGAINLAASKKLKSILLEMHSKKKIVAAICAAPSVVLAPAGILANKSATGYPGMRKNFNKNIRYKHKKVVACDNIITSQGPATAMQFALAIVERLAGIQTAERIKKAVLYK